MNLLKRFDIWLGKVCFPNSWPDDKEERKRIQAFILGAGSGGRASTIIEEEKHGDDKVQTGIGK